MDAIVKWLGEEALKAGGALAFAGAALGGYLAWPKDCPSTVGERVEALQSGSDCHHAFGALSTDVEAQVAVVIGFGAAGAILGAILAFGLVALGVSKRDDLGMPGE